MNKIGVVGLGVMGSNLARNFAGKGFKTAVYNRTYSKTEALIDDYGSETLLSYQKLKDFVASLERPRRIIMLVKAGSAVDSVIESLKPYLEKDDIIIDGGNSLFTDTMRRSAELQKEGLHFVGLGVSGGEEGALNGPSLMPGGTIHSWQNLKPALEAIAAKDFDGKPCTTHIGENGAGHYVKMVHNGIEYAIMQLMSESYDYLRKVCATSNQKIADIFEKFQTGKLNSFLFEISLPILRKIDDETGKPLLDVITDTAEQKGTGTWTSISAFELGVPAETINSAVLARYISRDREARGKLSEIYQNNPVKCEFIDTEMENSLYLAIMLAYIQGFELIRSAAEEYGWNINFAEVSRIWQGGCIIRAEMLRELNKIFERNGNISNLLFAPEIQEIMHKYYADLEKFLIKTIENRVPVPCFSASNNYFLSITSKELPANFIQALRDSFGAHTYRRKDKEGIFHTNW
ncbi:NADP-dependent phosphogluconate dehydrogenase [Candidatus Peregrinibacteria bacterium]|nr:NADP-dependent phosphogluconate dehydrogenase [Candidatus Peregrinibacteria bacterium]